VSGQPAVTVYKPAGIRTRELEWTNLTLDEFETIRLIDGEGLDQESVAGQMGVSRPTVTRILASARSKVARVLVSGQALLIEGGPVVQGPLEQGGKCGRRGQRCGDRKRLRGSGRNGRRVRGSGEGASRQTRKESAMNVAVTSRGPDLTSEVDSRFGRAKYIIIVDIATGEFTAHDNSGTADSGHGAGIQAGRRVIELGAQALITGRVGPKAYTTLQAGDVSVHDGAEGSVQSAIDQYKSGTLEHTAEPGVQGKA
jgi:predicted DNA-binding protein (UPF0251 family)/predicted Fe-Mo cluster-binding NifX family protein